ncbi:hypothetical protein CURE108131_25355 [Cupriavidus respiraculi]|uniref:Uncharacterized protein n=1 Tax=Cupriavidus respiraculi TaxID=195930 RepID=A0ABN7Z836_9BURK|nr:hypothetical protein [Cupriavidus respiraculi]CAG9182128.1 hypothetical protein LMG21510_04478 [Cupriavidus respiraculi]
MDALYCTLLLLLGALTGALLPLCAALDAGTPGGAAAGQPVAGEVR